MVKFDSMELIKVSKTSRLAHWMICALSICAGNVGAAPSPPQVSQGPESMLWTELFPYSFDEIDSADQLSPGEVYAVDYSLAMLRSRCEPAVLQGFLRLGVHRGTPSVYWDVVAFDTKVGDLLVTFHGTQRVLLVEISTTKLGGLKEADLPVVANTIFSDGMEIISAANGSHLLSPDPKYDGMRLIRPAGFLLKNGRLFVAIGSAAYNGKLSRDPKLRKAGVGPDYPKNPPDYSWFRDKSYISLGQHRGTGSVDAVLAGIQANRAKQNAPEPVQQRVRPD